MIRTRVPFIFVIGFILCTTSCYKKGSTGPAGPVGPSYVGAINGHFTVYDQYGDRLFNGYQNITATLKGGKTVAPDPVTGYYIFDSVATGTYKMQCSGTGLATTVLNNFTFINDTLYRDIGLSAVPTFSLTSFTAYHNAGSAYDSLVITVTADTKARNCIIFVSDKPGVSNDPASYIYTYVKTIAANATYMLVRVPASDLNVANIFYGQPVYYAAYSYVVNDVSVYEDMVTGRNVYNAVGAALADSAICP